MNNTRIVIGDIDLDLPDNFVIAQNLQAANVGDLAVRRLNVTSTVTVPDTPTNQSVYEQSNKVQSTTSVPYVKRNAKLIQNGIEVISKGVENIQSSGNGFSIYIQSGTKDFFDAIGEKSLNDLSGFKNGNYTNDTALKTNTSGIQMDVVYPGQLFGDSNTVRPFYFIGYMDVIDRIITDAGYTSSGAIFSDAKYLNMIVGAMGSTKRGYSDRFVDDRSVSVTKTTPQAFNVTTGGNGVKITFDNTIKGGTSPLGYWDGTSKYLANDTDFPAWTVTQGRLFLLRVKVSITITVAGGKTVDVVFGDNAIDSSTTYAGTSNNPYVAANVGSGTYTFDTDVLNPNNSFMKNGPAEFMTLSVQYRSGASPVAVTVSSASMTIEPYGIYDVGNATGQWIYFSDILPNIKQKDLFKDFAIRAGLIFDESNGVLTAKGIDEIIADRSNALDWSNKRDMTKNDYITYTPFTYAQINNFLYTPADGNVNELAGSASIDIANTNIATSKTIYKSIAQVFNPIIIGGVSTVHVPIYDNTDIELGNVSNNDPGFVLLLSRSNYASDTTVTDAKWGAQSVYRTAYFDDDMQPYSMNWEEFLDDHYDLFGSALQKAKLVKRDYYLTETDIAGFNFMLPVFDTDTYYIVNKIYNFIPGRITEVDLFKVST